jgi:uncharacterized protein (DUF488 family)
MQTATFRKSLDRCIELAKSERIVLMCADAVPWRCHRSSIAEALLARGIQASEITSSSARATARVDALGARLQQRQPPEVEVVDLAWRCHDTPSF